MAANEKWIAAIGPATGLLESTATAVGAGTVLGGFLAGLVAGWLMGRRGAELDHGVLVCGYVGGVAGLFALANDLMMG